jgi:predicted O-methyltransferase YrrM
MKKFPDWFSRVKPNFEEYLASYRGKDNLLFLQIGAYTGDASEWLCREILTSRSSILVDVDTWQGSDEEVHKEINFNEVEAHYDERMKPYPRVIKCKARSVDYLLAAEKESFDFIYVDGDHTSAAVIEDAILGWRALKPGGIMVFDDYRWSHPEKDERYWPMPAVDFFVNYYVLRENCNIFPVDELVQVWVQKL